MLLDVVVVVVKRKLYFFERHTSYRRYILLVRSIKTFVLGLSIHDSIVKAMKEKIMELLLYINGLRLERNNIQRTYNEDYTVQSLFYIQSNA